MSGGENMVPLGGMHIRIVTLDTGRDVRDKQTSYKSIQYRTTKIRSTEEYNYALLQYSKRVEIKVYKTVATELKYCDKHIEEG